MREALFIIATMLLCSLLAKQVVPVTAIGDEFAHLPYGVTDTSAPAIPVSRRTTPPPL